MKARVSVIGRAHILTACLALGLCWIMSTAPAAAAVREINVGAPELSSVLVTGDRLVKPFADRIMYGIPANPSGAPVSLTSYTQTISVPCT